MQEEKDIIQTKINENKFVFDAKKVLDEHLKFCRLFFCCFLFISSIITLFSQNEPLYKVFVMLCLASFLLPKVDMVFSKIVKIKNLKLFKYFIVCFFFSLIVIESKSDILICFFSAILFIPILFVFLFPFYAILKFIVLLKKKIVDIINNKKIDLELMESDKLENIDINNADEQQKKKSFFQEQKERELAVRIKVNELAKRYVDQFIVGNYPKHKIFGKEDVSVFETIIKDSLTDYEITYLRFIGIKQILQIKYNNCSYEKFRESFINDNDLANVSDFKTFILAYLNTFDENFDWIYYFVRYISEQQIKALSSEKTKNFD